MSLEQQYRRLLRAYPRHYQRHRGDEMISTLLDGASPDQRRPSRRDVADLLRGALRERLGMHAVPGFAAGLRVAGPICLLLAGASAVSGWILRNPGQGIEALVVAAVWLGAILGWLFWPSLSGWLVGLACLATLIVAATTKMPTFVWQFDTTSAGDGNSLVAISVPMDWHPMTLTSGLIALLALMTATSPPSGLERLAVTVALIGLSAATLRTAGRTNWPGWHLVFPPSVGWLWLLPLASFVVGIGIATRYGTTGGLWAGLVLLIPISATQFWRVGYYGAWNEHIGWMLGEAVPAPVVGAVLLTALVAVTVYLAARPGSAATAQDGSWQLARVGTLSLAAAGGICGFVLAYARHHHGSLDLGNTSLTSGDWIVLAATVLAAIVGPLVPARLGRAVVLAATITVAAGATAGWTTIEPAVIRAILLLLLVAAVAMRPAGVLGVAAAVTTTALMLGLSWLTYGRVYEWPAWTLQSSLIPSIAALAFLPTLWWSTVVAVRAEHGWLAMGAFAASGLWVMLLINPRHDGRMIAASVVVGLAALLGTRFVVRRLAGPGHLAAARPVPR